MARTKADKEGWKPKDRDKNNDVPVLKAKHPGKDESDVSYDIKAMPNIPTFNLSGLNLLELSRELQRSLNSSSSPFIFLRERQNKKLKLQKEKIQTILEIIGELRLTQHQLTQFQAETFLSKELLSAVVDEKREEIINLAGIKKKEFMIAHGVLDDKLSQLAHGKKSRELLLESAEIQNLKSRAELNLLTAQTEEAKAKAELIMFVVKELDLKNMPQTLQTYLISSIVNPQGSQYQDFDMQEQLKKFVLKEADAKSRHSTAIASTTEQQARIAEKTADKTVFDLDSIRHSPKS